MENTLCGFDPGTAPIAWQLGCAIRPFHHPQKGVRVQSLHFICFTSHWMNPMHAYSHNLSKKHKSLKKTPKKFTFLTSPHIVQMIRVVEIVWEKVCSHIHYTFTTHIDSDNGEGMPRLNQLIATSVNLMRAPPEPTQPRSNQLNQPTTWNQIKVILWIKKSNDYVNEIWNKKAKIRFNIVSTKACEI